MTIFVDLDFSITIYMFINLDLYTLFKIIINNAVLMSSQIRHQNKNGKLSFDTISFISF